ncbi:MAG: UDP-N-acetylmuramate dehydrogenase [Patescibacteria group bacterium]|nr:UDP-N-acetylmuramate dehydrogenase [Patescibacteria group bacterium]MDW8279979.1 UDP-N-acetylmuramate dehydrogenase [bacterium]
MVKFLKNISLKKYSNFQIGNKAKYFFEAKNLKDLKQALLKAKKLNLKIFILGGGTNILFKNDFNGLILKPNIKFIKSITKNIIRVGSGILVSDFLNFLVKKELSGMEWAGGLPGTIGGAIRGNAGAFGGEIKDNLVKIKSIDLNSLKEVIRTKKECIFGYRFSIFKDLNINELILWADFKFKKGNKNKIKKSILEKIEYRKLKHPMNYPNIGSIFKNVPINKFKKTIFNKYNLKNFIKTDPEPVIPAAVLISKCGLSNKKIGGAQISGKHSNFIININQAKAEDVLKLINFVEKKIYQKFKIKLEREIVVL